MLLSPDGKQRDRVGLILLAVAVADHRSRLRLDRGDLLIPAIVTFDAKFVYE